MSRQCYALNCSARIDNDKLMCKRHWFAVPARIRDEVWDSLRQGGVTSARYQQAIHDARFAVQSTPSIRGNPDVANSMQRNPLDDL